MHLHDGRSGGAGEKFYTSYSCECWICRERPSTLMAKSAKGLQAVKVETRILSIRGEIHIAGWQAVYHTDCT
jgi:hypothetical protein